jgi:hypothetical protein
VAACNTALPKTYHNTNSYWKTMSSRAQAAVSYTEANLYYCEAGNTILNLGYSVLASATIMTKLFSNISKNI